MFKNISDDLPSTTNRAIAEAIIIRYPKISDDELKAVLHYLKKEATAMDNALIASNPELTEPYRQLSHDHYLNRLRPMETAMVTGFVILIGLSLLLLSAIAKTI
ncbi:hypothetical protein MB02_00375 [Croceicoccus estronivorus]|uniref:hypothetical protein n=1 Tax=Croceicoccus estronivorus TaxID=1172626 RepID=UPI0008308E00|nr:hypothetical protein [Croceicoccus estronivorus]OCC25187.1 hypothetical protein MB02_00375 [Croceicoccus estronivorus]